MDVRFTPDMFLDYRLARHGLTREDLGVAPTVVVSWFPDLVDHLAGEAGATVCEHWLYRHRSFDLYRAVIDGIPVGFASLPVGAPGTVAYLEELMAVGARRLVGLGLAGSLQERAPVGSFLLPGSCIREEGTSPHYLPLDVEVRPDAALMSALEAAAARAGLETHSGRHWTTDAPYREFVWKIEKYRAEAVLGVDMETSAMYALGQFHGVPVANLLVVSDELWREWNPAFGTAGLREAMRRAAAAILAGLPALAGAGGDGQG